MCIRDSPSGLWHLLQTSLDLPWVSAVLHDFEYLSDTGSSELFSGPVSYTHLRAHETRRHL
eukprot:9729771-Prorocentrum_lima.AAC.1